MTGASAEPTALVGPEGLEPHSRLHASHDIASAGFTPGPWTVFSDDDCRYDHLPGIEALDGELSVVVVGYPDDDSCGVHGRNSGEAVANARLIAVAPELHRELSRLRMLAERFIEACPARTHKATQARNILYTAIDDADAALAKARGES